jgi:hypothetical protein
MISQEDARQRLFDINKGKTAALSVIEELRPIIEELQRNDSILLRRKLDKHAILINKIFNDLIQTGQADQVNVIELRLVLADLKEIYNDLRNYFDAKQKVNS